MLKTTVSNNLPPTLIHTQTQIKHGQTSKDYLGVYPQKNTHCLNNPTPTIDPREIANSFGQTWSEEAGDHNFSSAFRLNKELLNPTPNYIPTKTAIEIEKDITFIEFSSALNTLKGRTPCHDRISYCMIKNLPTTFKQRIINLYNEILSSRIPQSFKLSLVLPILKPQKPQTDIKSYRPISLNSCLILILCCTRTRFIFAPTFIRLVSNLLI